MKKDIYALVDECRLDSDCMQHLLSLVEIEKAGLIHFKNIRKTGRLLFYDEDLHYFLITDGGHHSLYELPDGVEFETSAYIGDVTPEVHGRKVGYEDIHINFDSDMCYWPGALKHMLDTLDIFCNMITEASI